MTHIRASFNIFVIKQRILIIIYEIICLVTRHYTMALLCQYTIVGIYHNVFFEHFVFKVHFRI